MCSWKLYLIMTSWLIKKKKYNFTTHQAKQKLKYIQSLSISTKKIDLANCSASNERTIVTKKFSDILSFVLWNSLFYSQKFSELFSGILRHSMAFLHRKDYKKIKIKIINQNKSIKQCYTYLKKQKSPFPVLNWCGQKCYLSFFWQAPELLWMRHIHIYIWIVYRQGQQNTSASQWILYIYINQSA